MKFSILPLPQFIRPWRALAFILVLPLFGLPGCGPGADGVEGHLLQAQEYRRSGDLRSAMIELRSAAQQDLHDAEVRHLLGTVLLELGDVTGAIKELRRAMDLGMERHLVILDLAGALLLNREYEVLVSELAVEDFPPAQNGYVRMLLLRANAYLPLRRWYEAKADLEEVLRRDPGNTGALRGLAYLSLGEGDQTKARNYLDAAVQNNPVDPRLWVAMGRLHQSSSRSKDAEKAFRHALQLDSDSFSARVGLAWALLGQNEPAQAREEAMKIERMAPDSLSVNHLLGTIAFVAREYDNAEIALQKALAQTNGDTRILLTLALTHYIQGHYEQAETLLRKFLETHPDFAPGHRMLVDILFRMEDSQSALEHLEGMGDKAKRNEALFKLMARAAILSGHEVEAGEYLDSAIQTTTGQESEALRQAAEQMRAGDANKALQALDRRQLRLAQRPQPTREDLVAAIDNVQDLMTQGQLAQALEHARKLATRYPDLAAPQNLLASVYLRQGNGQAARAGFEQAFALEPNNPTGVTNLARLELNQGNLEAARIYFDQVLRLVPNSVSNLQGMARIALLEGKTKEATDWLERARIADPTAIAPIVTLASIHLRDGRAALAMQFVRQAEKLSPAEAGVAQLVSDIYAAQREPERALEHFETLSARFPNAPALHYQLARAYRTLGRDREAEQEFKRAIALAPTHVGAITGLIRYAAADNRPSDALELAEGLVRRQPESWEGYTLVGDIQMRLGDASAAEESYRAGMQRKPGSALTNKLTQAQVASGAREQAMETLFSWLSEHPDDATVRHHLAVIYLREGEDEEALAEYHRIEKANPSDLLALNNMASLLTRMGRPDQALEYAHNANELRQGNPAIQDTLGWSLVQAGKTGDGLEYLQSAVQAAPDEPQIRYHLAVAQQRSNQEAAASKNLSEALASSVSFQSRQEAEELLKSLQANIQGVRLGD